MQEARTRAVEQKFVREFCVPFLIGAQNQDGGWGFYPDSTSRVEPTVWAFRALRNSPVRVSEECFQRALSFLRSTQCTDSSWPSIKEEETGSWVTSLVCSVFGEENTGEREAKAGLKWLCDDYPRDSTLWRRVLGKLRSSDKKLSSINASFRGWGWTPQTSSWVEPTAFALQAFRDCPQEWHPRAAEDRIKLAAGLLYDRMCPSGGWNCGNPMVYGVAGEPLVLPTAWALLSLRFQPPNERKTQSLNWLKSAYASIRGAASLAAARITLETYGFELPSTALNLPEMPDRRTFEPTTQVVSWTCLALSSNRSWFARQGEVA